MKTHSEKEYFKYNLLHARARVCVYEMYIQNTYIKCIY